MRISIITPSYNQGQFIEKTILSVINQPVDDIEYIIIDGGSTDDTVEVIKKYEDKIAYWCSEKDNGQSDALNKGFEKATGEIVAWINSDDYYEEGIFNDILELFKNPEINIVNGDCAMFYADRSHNWIDHSRLINTRRLLRYWKNRFCPPQPSIFFRKSVLDEVGKIDESLNYGMDLDLWLKMSLKYEFTYYNKVLSHYLIHDSSKSGSEGGFTKFEPEWRKICIKYLIKAPFKTKIKFCIDYTKHILLDKKN